MQNFKKFGKKKIYDVLQSREGHEKNDHGKKWLSSQATFEESSPIAEPMDVQGHAENEMGSPRYP